jgi:hypothetical protein
MEWQTRFGDRVMFSERSNPIAARRQLQSPVSRKGNLHRGRVSAFVSTGIQLDGWSALRWRLDIDFVAAANTVGAPRFAHFAKGGYSNPWQHEILRLHTHAI